jgi:hypothetical protein
MERAYRDRRGDRQRRSLSPSQIRDLRRPDFFLVGAPKCGTTALNHYLDQHPEIGMFGGKDVNFFAKDLPANRRRSWSTLEEYLTRFAYLGEAKKVGAACVWYLYSRRAATEIKAFSPSASIVAILRNPVDMVHSLHAQFVYAGAEGILDFEAALEAESDGGRSGAGPPQRPRLLRDGSYRSVARYAEQLKRYLDVFGAERVHIILFDDLARDSAGVYRELCSFIGVSPNFSPEFQIVNPNKRVRSPGLRELLERPPPFARWTVRAVTTSGVRHFLYWKTRQLNTKYKPRPPMAPELRRRLERELAPEVEKLANLLGRDLGHWLPPRTG